MPDAITPATQYLKEKGFELIDELGKGTFGSVFKVFSAQRGLMAAKIVKNRFVNQLEIKEWAKLDHQNILRLLDTIYDVNGVVIFVTDLMSTNLFLQLQNQEFKKDSNALERCRIYASQILSGLAYLHGMYLCHLDLRAENVFVTSDDRAIVADFSGLSWATDKKTYCPLPRSLRPPEMLTSKKKVEPMPIDLWAYGLLLANLFLGKGFYICTVKNSRAGQIEAVMQYTQLFQCSAYVKKFIYETYSFCSVSKEYTHKFMAFVSMFLQMDPMRRISAQEALRQNFLSNSAIKADPSENPATTEGPSTSGTQEVRVSSVPSEQVSTQNSEDKIIDNVENSDAEKQKHKKKKWKKINFKRLKFFHISSPPMFKPKVSKKKKEERRDNISRKIKSHEISEK